MCVSSGDIPHRHIRHHRQTHRGHSSGNRMKSLPDSILHRIYGMMAPVMVVSHRIVCIWFYAELPHAHQVSLRRGAEQDVTGSMLLCYPRDVSFSCGYPELVLPAILDALRGGWTGLVALDLTNLPSRNGMDDQGMQAPHHLPSTLHSLRLSNNRIVHTGAKSLARVLGSLTGLRANDVR